MFSVVKPTLCTSPSKSHLRLLRLRRTRRRILRLLLWSKLPPSSRMASIPSPQQYNNHKNSRTSQSRRWQSSGRRALLRPSRPARLRFRRSKTGDIGAATTTHTSLSIRHRFWARATTIPPGHGTISSSRPSSTGTLDRTTITTTTISTTRTEAMAAAEVAPEIIIISIGTAGQPEAANLTPIAKRRAIITKRVASRSVRSRSSSSSHGVAVRATSTTMTTTSWPTGRPTARAPAIVPTMHGEYRIQGLVAYLFVSTNISGEYSEGLLQGVSSKGHFRRGSRLVLDESHSMLNELTILDCRKHITSGGNPTGTSDRT
uniref:(northern house mosquito) hypothetical protein n=1 Tax=Culex pipiens TaxID=7175 RepID=A0A8D8FNP7_CULPI